MLLSSRSVRSPASLPAPFLLPAVQATLLPSLQVLLQGTADLQAASEVRARAEQAAQEVSRPQGASQE